MSAEIARGALLAMVTAALATASAAQDAAPGELQPLGPWQLDMAENKCRIARLFGDAAAPTLFYLEQWAPGTGALWGIAGPPVTKFQSRRKIGFAFGDAGDRGDFYAVSSTLGDFGSAISEWSPITQLRNEDSPIDSPGTGLLDSDRGNAVDYVALQQGKRSVRLMTGPMGDALRAMNACMDDLVRHWGFDPDEQRRVASPPAVTNMESVARSIQDHYPSDALDVGAQADFHMRIVIEADGAIGDCILLNQTLADRFDTNAGPCAVVRRKARARAAQLPDGTPLRSFVTTRIVYRVS